MYVARPLRDAYKEGQTEGRKEGRKEGREEGRKEGRENEIVRMYIDGDISEDVALKRLDWSKDKLDKTVIRYTAEEA